MENVSSLRNTQIIENQKSVSCWQQPLTKAALFVTAFLFAGAAAGAHFAGWGFPAIVGFGSVSAAFLLGALVCCVASANGVEGADREEKEPSIDWTQYQKNTSDFFLNKMDKPIQEKALAKQKDVKRLTNTELYAAIPDSLSDALLEKDGALGLALMLEMEFRMEHYLNLYKADNAALARPLQEFANGLSTSSNSPDKMRLLLGTALRLAPPAQRDALVAVFQGLKWPNDAVREAVLNDLLEAKESTHFNDENLG